eukprot:5389825-Amphidinium_carterae.1
MAQVQALAEQLRNVEREMARLQMERELSNRMTTLEENQRKLMEQNKEIMRLLHKRPISPPAQLLTKAAKVTPLPAPVPKSTHMRALKMAKKKDDAIAAIEDRRGATDTAIEDRRGL